MEYCYSTIKEWRSAHVFFFLKCNGCMMLGVIVREGMFIPGNWLLRALHLSFYMINGRILTVFLLSARITWCKLIIKVSRLSNKIAESLSRMGKFKANEQSYCPCKMTKAKPFFVCVWVFFKDKLGRGRFKKK